MKQMLPIGIGLIVVGALLALFNSGDTPYPTYTLIAGVALVAVYVLANLREMGKRSTMYGLNALLMSGFMVAILVVIYLIAQNRDKTWDFSATGKYTLDPQTASILDSLESPVELLVFYPTPIRTGREFELIKSLLDQYTARSGKLTYKVLDPSKDYDTAMEYRTLLNSSLEPTIIAEVKGEGAPFREKAKGTKQEDISNAIKKVTHRTSVHAYFLVGHYEKELESENPAGLALLKQFLEEENFTVSPLRLPATGDIPEDAQILALVGPEEELTDVEREAIRRFVLRGGAL
ncbi:MAG: GldG family protein, partial [Candidatus Omnitrophica bacterium]|nr:GldG family protein [Candidatus Omnitrophota bacterium]